MQALACGTQSYDWGKTAADSEVASLVGADTNEAKRYAELWIGAHPKLPSMVLSSGEQLQDFLSANRERYLGSDHVDYFSKWKVDRTQADTLAATSVPFLLKVLSIDKALSIQAHPTRELAEVLHARDPSNYPDPNHKPELIVAVTPFEALCCFRPIEEILYFVDACPPLQCLLGDKVISGLRGCAVEDEGYRATGSVPLPKAVKEALHACMERLYSTAPSTNVGLLQEMGALASSPKFIASLPPHRNRLMGAAFELFVRVGRSFGGDIGLWMVFVLNYLQMSPGEALYLGASEPHAYLSGNGVEIMASSDNVVRAGLTPKYKDVGTLLDMLTYDTNALAQSKYSFSLGHVQEYAPPKGACDDFSLLAVRLAAGESTSYTIPSVGLGVCLGGECAVGAGGSESVIKRGACFVVPHGNTTFRAAGSGAVIFIGTTNVHNTKSAKL